MKKYFFYVMCVFAIFMCNFVQAATINNFENVTEKAGNVIVVKKGTIIEYLNDQAVISLDNHQVAFVEGRKIKIVDSGRFNVTVEIPGKQDIDSYQFFAWNACLKSGRYWTYKDENRKTKSEILYSKTYLDLSKANKNAFLVEDYVFKSGSYRGELKGKYITTYYDESKNKSTTSNYEYAMKSDFKAPEIISGEDHTHKYTIFVKKEKESTCTDKGLSVYKCEKCDMTQNVEEKILEHDYKIQAKDENNHQKLCTRCGNIVESEKHSFDNVSKCIVCGYEKTEKNPATSIKNSKIHFINTGASSAFLIESNGKFGLIDTSNPLLKDSVADSKEIAELSEKHTVAQVVKYLNKVMPEGKKLDFLLVTHAHYDHIGGVKEIANKFVDKNTVYYYRNYSGSQDTETWGNLDYYNQAKTAMEQKNAIFEDLTDQEGYSTDLGEFKIEFYNTYSRKSLGYTGIAGSENEHSIVTLIKYGNSKVLLAGDIHVEQEKRLIATSNIGKVNILKVGHHGYASSSCYEFLEGMAPQQIIVDGSGLNLNQSIVRYFTKAKKDVNVYVTANSTDAIVIDFNDDGYEIKDDGKKGKNDLKLKYSIIKSGKWNRIIYRNGNKESSHWYYCDANGNELKGWQYLPIANGNKYWFFFDESGRMEKGWKLFGGNWYYLCNSDNEISGFCEGSMVTGWQKLYDLEKKQHWYYFDNNGRMLTGWQELKVSSGETYRFYFNDDGEMLTGWQKLKVSSGKTYWFYFNDNGEMQTDWQLLDGKWYYLCKSDNEISGYCEGAMLTGRHELMYNGQKNYYYFCEYDGMPAGYKEGVMLSNVTYNGYTYDSSGKEIVEVNPSIQAGTSNEDYRTLEFNPNSISDRKNLQTHLKELRYYNDNIDGIFGKNTLNAINQALSKHGFGRTLASNAKWKNIDNEMYSFIMSIPIPPKPTVTKKFKEETGNWDQSWIEYEIKDRAEKINAVIIYFHGVYSDDGKLYNLPIDFANAGSLNMPNDVVMVCPIIRREDKKDLNEFFFDSSIGGRNGTSKVESFIGDVIAKFPDAAIIIEGHSNGTKIMGVLANNKIQNKYTKIDGFGFFSPNFEVYNIDDKLSNIFVARGYDDPTAKSNADYVVADANKNIVKYPVNSNLKKIASTHGQAPKIMTTDMHWNWVRNVIESK